MKKFSYIIFFIPLIVYIILMMFNFSVLSLSSEISFFALWSIQMPVVLFITLFFVAYIVTIWFVLKFSDFFSERKNRKLEEKVNALKAELFDNQSELIESITSDFRSILSKFQKENNDTVVAFKSENQKVVSNIEFELQNIKNNLK